MNWSNITIEQYQQILAIEKTDLPNFNKEVQLVSYLFDIPINDCLQMPLSSFQEYERRLAFLSEMPKHEPKAEFIIDGVKYKVCWEMHTKTAGQFIDLTELTKEPELINDNLHLIMAVLCTPKGEKYNSEEVLKRAELFKKKLTMDIVLPLATFFLSVFENSLKVIADSLNENITKENEALRAMLVDYMSTGDGIALSMN